MPFEQSSVAVSGDLTHRKLFIAFQGFLSGINKMTFAGAGAPTLHGYGEINFAYCDAGVVEETITIICTDDSNINAPVFSVSGSVSGVLPNATGGVAYVNNNIRFTISLDWDNNTDGDTDTPYTVGDTFTFETVNSVLVQAGNAWELLRDLKVAGVTDTDEYGVTLRARGPAGTDNTYLTFQTHTNEGSNLYYWRAYTGRYENLWLEETGLSELSPYTSLSLWNGVMDYYFIANAQRVIVAVRLPTGQTMAGYFGLGFTYALPTEYTYPVFISGNGRDAFAPTSTNPGFRNFFDSYVACGVINTPQQQFINVGNTYGTSTVLRSGTINGELIEPRGLNPVAPYMTLDPAGKYYLINSIIVSNNTGVGPLIMLDGVYFFPGEAPIASFDTLDQNGDTFLVVNNIYLNNIGDFSALRLD